MEEKAPVTVEQKPPSRISLHQTETPGEVEEVKNDEEEVKNEMPWE